MREGQKVFEMVDEVLLRQVEERIERYGETPRIAFERVSCTEGGRLLLELRDGPHGGERAASWQQDLAKERAKKREEALGHRLP